MKLAMRFIGIFAVIVCLVAPACAEGELRFAELGPFRLDSGKTIVNCRIGYRTLGVLNRDRSNAVLVPTWLAGTSQELVDLGFIGPGKMVDSSRHFVVAIDALGNGVSSSPSNSKEQQGALFPRFTIKDMVRAQHLVLTEYLNIHQLRGAVGISMGGMQVFQWMVAYPRFLDKAIPISGSPRLAPSDLLVWQAQIDAIERARTCNDESSAMKGVAPIQIFASRTPAYFAGRVSPDEFASFLASGEKGLMKYDPVNWQRQLEAMMALNVMKPFGNTVSKTAIQVKARTLVVVSRQDQMVYPGPALEFAKATKAEVYELTGDCGHFAFFCESEKLSKAVAEFLNR
jgi:homoserine O-acetyltransferase/O-succinyltransferase